MNSNISVIHELTPRQFILFNFAYSIIRHHSLDILKNQVENNVSGKNSINNIIVEMRCILIINKSDKYVLKLSDIIHLKSMLSSLFEGFNILNCCDNYMAWKACSCVIELLELLYAEILYDDSLIDSDVLPAKFDSGL